MQTLYRAAQIVRKKVIDFINSRSDISAYILEEETNPFDKTERGLLIKCAGQVPYKIVGPWGSIPLLDCTLINNDASFRNLFDDLGNNLYSETEEGLTYAITDLDGFPLPYPELSEKISSRSYFDEIRSSENAKTQRLLTNYI